MSEPDTHDLRHRLEAMNLDVDGASLPFSRRLARDNGWSEAYSERVIAEYKRFVYLAMTAGHPVTPSDEVDQAWHLHLAYTHHYWDEMCGEILGKPLHHGPTRGGHSESAKYHDWYSRTLDSYERSFGEAPPPDVWPAPEQRFRDADGFRRINANRMLLVPLRRAQVFTLGALALVLAGCSLDGKFGWSEGLLVFALIGVIIWIAKRSSRGGGSGCSAGGGCGTGGARTPPGDDGGSGCSGGDSGCGGGCGGCGG